MDTDRMSTADESQKTSEPDTEVAKELPCDSTSDLPPVAAPLENGVSTSGDESAKGDGASSQSDDSQDEDACEKVGVVEEVTAQPKTVAANVPKASKRKGFACRCGEKTCRRFLFSYRE